MATDALIILSLCILGLLDCWLERFTGRGLIARAQDLVDAATHYRFRRRAK